MDLIEQARAALNNATAIYVVYISGPTLFGGAIGNGGPSVTFLNSTDVYSIYGRVVMPDDSYETYTLAHEFGHVLFGRFLDDNFDNFTIDDPTNPGSGHSNDPQNLMYFVSPARNPVITSEQCMVARQSRIVLENDFLTVDTSGMPFAGASADSGMNENQNPVSSSGRSSFRKDCHQRKKPDDPCEECLERRNPRFNKPQIVKKVNEDIACMLEKLGPETAQLFPGPCRDKKRKC